MITRRLCVCRTPDTAWHWWRSSKVMPGWVAGCGYVPRVISGLRVRTKWLRYVRRVIKGRHSHRYSRPTFTSGCGGGGVSWGGVDFPLDVFCLPTMQPPQPLEAWLAWQWWCWCKVIAGVPLIVVNRMAPPAVVAAIDVHKQDGATHCHHSKVNVCGQKGIGPTSNDCQQS